MTWSWTRALIASTLIPALTSPTTRPSSVTGVTARTDGPSVPVYVSVKVCPRRAGPVRPRKRRPISSRVGWVQRMPRGSMIVTKSTSASRITCSAYGSSSAEGSGVPIAARTEGASAMDRATAVTWRSAASRAWRWSLT